MLDSRVHGHASAVLPHNIVQIEFKLVKVSAGGVEWEGGSNRTLVLAPGEASALQLTWGKAGDGAAPQGGQPQARQQQQQQTQQQQSRPNSPGGSAGGSPLSSGSDVEASVPSAWQGKGITFMRSNEHTRERNGVWDTSGLSGPALTLVQVRPGRSKRRRAAAPCPLAVTYAREEGPLIRQQFTLHHLRQKRCQLAGALARKPRCFCPALILTPPPAPARS